MKFSVLSENLKRGIGVAMRAISTRVQLPVLVNVLIRANKDGVELLATDLEISLRVKVRAKVDEEGEIIVPGKLFGELVNTLPPGAVEIVSEKQTLLIRNEKIESQLNGQAAEEFPSLPTIAGKGFPLPVASLHDKMAKIAVAAAHDGSRPVINGVLMIMGESLKIVATDGFRLALDEIGEIKSEENKFVLPLRSINELIKIGETATEIMFYLDLEKQQALFSDGEVEMSSRLIAGEFPPYERVIPVNKTTTLYMDTKSLSEAVKRASLFARDAANVVKLEAKEGKLEVVAQNDQRGSARSFIEGEIEGEEVTVAFNAKYLLEYLSTVDKERVIMETEGELKPALFKVPEQNSYLHVIMPVRVNG